MTTHRNYEKFAWPGGYEIAYILDDGELLCADCANDPTNPVQELRVDPTNHRYSAETTKNEYHDGWGIIGQTNTSEYDDLENCCHCYKQIGA